MDKRALFIERTKKSLKKAFGEKDRVLVVVTKTIEDLNKALNLMGERLEDWYRIYFPELEIKDRQKLARLVLILDKKRPDAKKIEEVVGRKVEEVVEKARESVGAEFSEREMERCRRYAEMFLRVWEEREELYRYQRELAKEIAPNACEVVGPEVCAKLIAHVGSLKRLALLPASAVQILGAEKALFKHLKNKRIPPPKHGILFTHPKISSVPKKIRGKVARALAGKLAVALRADAFGGSAEIGKKLREEFNKRFKEIVKKGGKNEGKAQRG